MPLQDIELSTPGTRIPSDIRDFLREAYLRVGQHVKDSPIRIQGFAPSGFATVYESLLAIIDADLATGSSFCEWGSGFGAATSLAAMLQFDACGIEIELDLVVASQCLADDFSLPVQFVHGSFVPPGGAATPIAECAFTADEIVRMSTDPGSPYRQLGLDADAFDLVFAYPWPSEERWVEDLFVEFSADNALLLTYTEFDTVRLRRNLSG